MTIDLEHEINKELFMLNRIKVAQFYYLYTEKYFWQM